MEMQGCLDCTKGHQPAGAKSHAKGLTNTNTLALVAMRHKHASTPACMPSHLVNTNMDIRAYGTR